MQKNAKCHRNLLWMVILFLSYQPLVFNWFSWLCTNLGGMMTSKILRSLWAQYYLMIIHKNAVYHWTMTWEMTKKGKLLPSKWNWIMQQKVALRECFEIDIYWFLCLHLTYNLTWASFKYSWSKTCLFALNWWFQNSN